jgi:hypothetical protein
MKIKTYCVTIMEWLYVFDVKAKEELIVTVHVDEVIGVVAKRLIFDDITDYTEITCHGHINFIVSQSVSEVMELIQNAVRRKPE